MSHHLSSLRCIVKKKLIVKSKSYGLDLLFPQDLIRDVGGATTFVIAIGGGSGIARIVGQATNN